MRILLIAAATILCGVGCTFYGVQALSTNSPVQQQTANDISSDTRANIQKLSSANARERSEAACRLGKARAAAAIPALIQLLSDDTPVEQPVCDEKGNWRGREMNKTTPGEIAAVALSQIGREAVEPLTAALRSRAWQARANAAFALGLIHDDRVVEPLISATRDTEARVREKASWSLGLVGDHRAVEPLSVALKDTDARVRSQAAWALGLKGDERSVEPLILALQDQNEEVQSQAAWALGLKGDDRAVEPLRIALNDPDENVRKQARWALDLRDLKIGKRIKMREKDVDVKVDVDVDVNVDPDVKVKPKPEPKPKP
jgi:HEAT repeat protein